MPIVHVRAMERERGTVRQALADIAQAVAVSVGCATEDVWCTFTPATEMTDRDRGGRRYR